MSHEKTMTDLEWLARNVHKFPVGMKALKKTNKSAVFQDDEDYLKNHDWYSKEEWRTERAVLQSKPSWHDAPGWANWLARNKNGIWDWHVEKPYPEHRCGTLEQRPESAWDEDRINAIGQNGMGSRQMGEIKSFQAKHEDAVFGHDLLLTNDKTPTKQYWTPIRKQQDVSATMSELYPQYYKDCRHIDSIDVYGVHDLFGIQDESGCLQHASKKILLSGKRNGGKDLYQDIKEARDTLTRKLQLMEARK